jgi:hypothetical protein
MKKTLLLSVVASTMIMAGGSIAPVEPVVEAPVVAETSAASGWDFSGQAVVYYQTSDAFGTGDLFAQETSKAAAGIQLGAVNKDLFAGFGAGFELSGLSSVGLEQDVVSGMVQSMYAGDLTSAGITQAYLTYGIGNTSVKVGRQALPKALSPFAFSEGWNVFKNTFEAALVVNSDIPDTTLVYAYVTRSNNVFELAKWSRINNNHDNGAVHMITAQNKSVDGLTLTGTYYLAPDFSPADDLSVIWGDAKFGISNYTAAIQGGTILAEDLAPGLNDTTAFGAKIGATFGMFDTSVAYSTVDDGTVAVTNFGTGVKTPLYTQMILNQGSIKSDNDTVVLRAGAKALGGKFGVAYDMTTDNSVAGNDTTELDLTYVTTVGNVKMLAAYVLRTQDIGDDLNVVRFWARYNF